MQIQANKHIEIKAKGDPEWTPLSEHLAQVENVAVKFAKATGLDTKIAHIGAIFHDIGKAHPLFQERLKKRDSEPPFRHEIASLFFLPLLPKNTKDKVIEMVIAHHKSILNDRRGRGILDLHENEPDNLETHLNNWEKWSLTALEILKYFNISVRPVSRNEAISAYEQVLDYCNELTQKRGYSIWRGLLIGADHFASAIKGNTLLKSKNIFNIPNLSFYQRQHPLYPLSYYQADSVVHKHTLVLAPTGAGKTDFLLRRCKNRVFYTLPYQASINAMYQRLKKDLSRDNSNLNIKLLHAASSIIKDENNDEDDVVLQRHIGASVKILTPYQMAGIIFGTKGYEATILDLKEQDIILDEVHTYSHISQAIVLRIIKVLNDIGCRIHIGTATMPRSLYREILKILTPQRTLEISLSGKELDNYNRHKIFKIDEWEEAIEIVKDALAKNEKVLIVCNRVKKAQEIYRIVKDKFQNIEKILIHSRFMRKDRKEKERVLIGLDERGNKTYQFNTSPNACIVVSTQVVEVSLDISFDLMITECAPLDSLIQRFGRINRKRDISTIGNVKPIYVLNPPTDSKSARPYDIEILKKSYAILENGKILRERELQEKLDKVFPEIKIPKIDESTVFKSNGTWTISPLQNGNVWLPELLEINSVVCIPENYLSNYFDSNYEQRIEMEIPTHYYSVKGLPRIEVGNRPYLIPKSAYDHEIGLQTDKLREELLLSDNQII